MKPNAISLRRRQLMVAGLAGATTPLTVFAAPRSAAPRAALAAGHSASAGSGMEKLVISGRIVGGDRKSLASAVVEAWHARSNAHRGPGVITDADGRFVLTLTTPGGDSGRPRSVHCRVSLDGHQTLVTQLRFARAPGGAADQVSRLERDEAGVWRTTFGLTLA